MVKGYRDVNGARFDGLGNSALTVYKEDPPSNFCQIYFTCTLINNINLYCKSLYSQLI